MLACDELAKRSLRNRDDRATGRTGRVAGDASRAEIGGNPIASSEPAERQSVRNHETQAGARAHMFGCRHAAVAVDADHRIGGGVRGCAFGSHDRDCRDGCGDHD